MGRDNCIERQQGMVLLEALIAFVILAFSVGAITQVLQTSSRNHRLAHRYLVAASHAESLMAQLGSKSPIRAGQSNGRIDDVFSWRIVVSPIASKPGEKMSNGNLPALVRIATRIDWLDYGQPRSLDLTTMRVVGERQL